ncbi:J domain-containing protein [Cohnella mopanensis]|uniref:J domain-containing protein n=1 Tax=Cohnella mopanensis TaxID=2911966 RepID=UPI001EF8FB47|nr:J domain-containing protein [Cohnella mopanensis]
MQFWKILGIEPTDDVSAIKRAYAVKLKIHHPEEDPEGYQRLREAYDQAVKQAKQKAKKAINRDITETEDDGREVSAALEQELDEHEHENEHEDEPEDEHEDEDDADPDHPYHPYRLLSFQESNNPFVPDHPFERFIEQIEALYENFSLRVDTNKWMELLDSDAVWNVELNRTTSRILLDFMEEHYFVPDAVWKLLENTFHWRDLAEEDKESFQGQYPKVYTYGIGNELVLNMGYSVLLNAADLDHDVFLLARENALLALLEQDYSAAERHLRKATERFESDPDVIRLQIECYSRLKNPERALDACNGLILLIPDSVEGHLNRARINFEDGKPQEVLQDLSRILERIPNHTSALSLAGRSYMKLGKYDKAHEMYQRIQKENANDIEAMLALAELSAIKAETIKKQEGSGNRKTLKQLKIDLGKTPLSYRLKQSAFLLLGGKWFSLIAIIALHIFISSSFVKHTGETPIRFLIHATKPIEYKTVVSLADLDSDSLLPKASTTVRMELSKATYMGINQVRMKDDDGNPKIAYLSTAEVEKQDLLSNISGYLNFVILDGTPLLILSDYDQAKAIYDKKTIEIKGTVQSLNPTLAGEYEKWKKRFLKADQSPLADKYLNLIEKPASDQSSIPLRIYFYLLALALFYISVFREVRRVTRYLRYT